MTSKCKAEIEPDNLSASIRRRFESLGGIDLELPPRAFTGEPIDFGSFEEDTDGAEKVIHTRLGSIFRDDIDGGGAK